MPGCDTAECGCVIEVGDGLTITGSGTLDNPFVVSLSGGLGGSLRVRSSETVELSLLGAGNPADPFILEANATIKMADLTDVQGTPSAGDVPIFDGAKFVYSSPAVAPGAVTTGDGILGDGSAGNPVRVALIGTSEGDGGGLEVYVDSAGNLRAVSPSVASVDWDSISEKPNFFPTNSTEFDGVLAVTKGGTGQSSLTAVTVGNSSKVDGHRIIVQSSTPATAGLTTNDLWLY